jgi:hypothetical protein
LVFCDCEFGFVFFCCVVGFLFRGFGCFFFVFRRIASKLAAPAMLWVMVMMLVSVLVCCCDESNKNGIRACGGSVAGAFVRVIWSVSSLCDKS